MNTASLFMVAALAQGAGDLPVPPASAPASFDQTLVINSVPTHVREWHLELAQGDAVEFYRGLLGEHRVELNIGAALILAAPRAGRFMTVELSSMPARRTRVRVAEAALHAAGTGAGAVPLPRDAKLLSRIASREGGVDSQTWVATSPAGMASNVDFFNHRLTTLGFRLADRQSVFLAGRRGEILAFLRPGHRFDIILTQELGRTWVSIVSTQAPK